MKLTCAERLMLNALRNFHREHGHMPTAKQLMFECGWKARSPVVRYIRSLNAKGAIRFHSRALPVTLC